MAGTAALAMVGRACADETAPGNAQTCANCAYFTAKPGSNAGTCSYHGDQPVGADGSCGNYK
jgi:hypothetical protein